MAIRLEKMIPLPMLEQQRDSSGIWEAESVVFEQGSKVLKTMIWPCAALSKLIPGQFTISQWCYATGDAILKVPRQVST